MWYVAQVRSGREVATLALCKKLVSAQAMQDCFAPEYEVMWRMRGQWKLVKRLLFPGYLFFVTDDVEQLAKELRAVPALTKLLGDDENSFYPLTDNERDWFLAFFDNEHVVRMSEGIIEGDVVKVTRGPLMGMEGQIRKIDRHKRRAYLDVSLFGRTVPTNVGLEIVRKTAASETQEAAKQLLGGGVHKHVLLRCLRMREKSCLRSMMASRQSSRVLYRFAKRLFDVVFSLVVIVVLAIPIAVVCVAIRIESPGCPVYSQERVGWRGKPLRIYKLRSMVADADDAEKYLDDEQLAQWKSERKVEDDPRVTRIGRVIRATSLDEIPQFWNVLRGDMSVIGPRPVSMSEFSWLGEDAEEYLSVRGGITGLWQTTSRNDATWKSGERLAIELDYVENAGFAMDAQIFIDTFGVMFGKGRSGR